MAVYFKGNLTEHFTLDEYSIDQTGKVYITKESMLHAQMLEEFREWLGRTITVHSWYRTTAYNKSVGGVRGSSHLKGLATDWHTTKKIDEKTFIKYAKKWKEICESHGVIGEAGLYTWGMHLGSCVTYTTKFNHWDSRSGKQINNPFKI